MGSVNRKLPGPWDTGGSRSQSEGGSTLTQQRQKAARGGWGHRLDSAGWFHLRQGQAQCFSRYRLLRNVREHRAGKSSTWDVLFVQEASPPACLFTLEGASLSGVSRLISSTSGLKSITQSFCLVLDYWSEVCTPGMQMQVNYEATLVRTHFVTLTWRGTKQKMGFQSSFWLQ